MQVLERRTLVDITSGDGRPDAAGDLAFARIEHGYPSELLDDVLLRSRQLRDAAQPKERRFLGFDHLRRVQETIPEVAELVHDRSRLDRLSDIAGVELEPYPIGTSCSGVNFYWPGQQPIQFHCDGPAFVELVPAGRSTSGSPGYGPGATSPTTNCCPSPSASVPAPCCRAGCCCTPQRPCSTAIA